MPAVCSVMQDTECTKKKRHETAAVVILHLDHMNIGIFGGTFNPVHFGHLRIAEEARQSAGLGRIIFIPSGNPPLKTDDIAAARHRLAMTRLAAQGNPFFEVLDIECRSRHKSYTVHTMHKLRGIYPHDRLFFMLGIDAYLDIPNWYRPDLLMRHTNFVILSRPGCRFTDLSASPYLSVKTNILRRLDAKILESHTVSFEDNNSVTLLNVTPVTISATDIRTLAAQGKSVKYLLPAEVESYIIFENLYGSGKRRHRAVMGGCR
jgi:nicotinate-nucleotide adenylyltransferase